MSNARSADELFDDLGKKAVASVAAHKNDAPQGFTELPPIDSGVAKLLRVEFYNDEGVLKFRAVAAVVAPSVLPGGIPTAGLETVQFAILPVADPDAGIADVLQVFRKMVGQTILDKLTASYGNQPRGLSLMARSIMDNAAKEPIYFRFSNKFEENKTGRLDPKTSQPYPGRCWQRWNAFIPGYSPPSFSSASTLAPRPSTNGTHSVEHRDSNGKVKSDPASWSERNTPVLTDAGAIEGDDGSTPDVAALVARAEKGELTAQNDLESLAGQLGYTTDDVAEASGWSQVGGWVKSGVKKGAESVAVVELPGIGTTCKFLPPDANDPTKRLLRAVNCEVISHEDGKIKVKSLTNANRQWLVAPDDAHLTFGS